MSTGGEGVQTLKQRGGQRCQAGRWLATQSGKYRNTFTKCLRKPEPGSVYCQVCKLAALERVRAVAR